MWLAIHLPGQVFELFTADSTHGDISTVRVESASVLLIEVVVMFALWFFPQSIARKLLTSTASDPQSPSSADTWLRLGCGLIGVWVLATSLPKLMLDAFVLYSIKPDDASSLRFTVIYYLAEVAIAVWLIVGAKGFREVFWWAQNAGVSKHSGQTRD